MFTTPSLIALAGLLLLLLFSIRWVFGAPKPKRVRATAVVRGTRREDGTWERDESHARDRR